MQFDSPSAFPLPRLPSSSSTAAARTPSRPRSRFDSPVGTFDLFSSPQLDPGGLERRWIGDGGDPFRRQLSTASAPSSPAFAHEGQSSLGLALKRSSGSGSRAIDTMRVFGTEEGSELPAQFKKPSRNPQASFLVASLARRTSSSSTASSTTRCGPHALDPAFLSNPFFAPFDESPSALATFPPVRRRQNSRLSVATTSPGGIGEIRMSSSPLQPPTPPFHLPPPPTPLLKRRISIPLPPTSVSSHNSQAQPLAASGPLFGRDAGATQTSLSATRTRLRGDEEDWGSLKRLDGVKRRRVLLAGSGDADVDGELGLTISRSSIDRVVSSLAQPNNFPSSPPSTDTEKLVDLPRRQASGSLRPRILLRLPKSGAQRTPSSVGAANSPAKAPPTATHRRRISVSSSISSLADEDAEDEEDEPPSESSAPSPPPARPRPRVRAPAPTPALASATRSRSRQVLEGSAAAAAVTASVDLGLTFSKGSSLSPSVSLPDEEQDVGPISLTGPSHALDLDEVGRSRVSSPLSDLSSVADAMESMPLPAPEPGIYAVLEPAGRRSFPEGVDLSFVDEYPAWYRRFRVPSILWTAIADELHLPHSSPPTGYRSTGAKLSEPRAQGPADVYAPRIIKGIGGDKMGACPVCIDDGAGVEWYRTKVSQYNFHMLYSHGISPTTGLPFSPPLRFRQTARVQSRPDEKTSLREGLCHVCQQWIPVEGVKAVEVRVKEIFWWKHAKSCHRASRIAGDTDIWTASPLLTLLTNYIDSLPAENKNGWIVPSEHISLAADLTLR